MRSKQTLFIGLAGLFAIAVALWWVGGEGVVRETRQPLVERDPVPFVRLSVTRNTASGVVAIRHSALVETGVALLTGQGGHYVVLDGPDGVLAAAPFTFPTQIVEEVSREDSTESREIDLVDQDVVVYVPYVSDAVGVRILDTQGATVAQLSERELDTLAAAQDATAIVKGWDSVRSTISPVVHAASASDELRAAFPHILFPTFMGELAVGAQGRVSEIINIDLDDYWAPLLHDLLTELSQRSPALLGSLASVAVVEYAPSNGFLYGLEDGGDGEIWQVQGTAYGNQIILNAHSRAGAQDLFNDPFEQFMLGGCDPSVEEDCEGMAALFPPPDFIPDVMPRHIVRKTLAHEAVHAFNNIVDERSNVKKESLPDDVLAHVNTVRELLSPWNFILSGTWRSLHNTARMVSSVYGEYAGPNFAAQYPTIEQAVRAGFKRPYGAKNNLEDLATYVETFYDRTPLDHPVCQQFTELTDDIPREQVLHFAKLNFMRGLGIISEAAYSECVQDADPATHEGFRIGDKNFTDDLKAGILGRPDGQEGSRILGTRFAVMGKTAGLQAMIKTYSPPLVQFTLLDDALGGFGAVPNIPLPTGVDGSSNTPIAVPGETQGSAMVWRPANPIRFFKLSTTLGWMTPYILGRPGKVGGRGYEGLNMVTYQPTSGSGIDLTRKTRISRKTVCAEDHPDCGAGGFIVVTNYTPGLTKGYAFFVQMEDWLGRSKRRPEESIADFAMSTDPEGPVVFDLIWFRVED
mgnify:CR=1 FL=1